MAFDKNDIKNIREDITNMLIGVEKKYNIKLELGSISYGERDFRSTLTGFMPENGVGEVEDKIAYDFKKKCGKYGLTPDNLGATFMSNGEKFTITGLKPRNRKYPIICDGPKGKSFKFAAITVLSKLNIDPRSNMLNFIEGN